MQQGILHLHNIMRWVILILLLVAIFRAVSGVTSKRLYTGGDRKTALFLMIATHINLLIGLYLWFTSEWGFNNIKENGMGQVMKNGVARFWAIEHITLMIIGVILITIGNSVSKKNISPERKHQKSLWLFVLALVIIAAAVPWPFREVGRPLLPGMD